MYNVATMCPSNTSFCPTANELLDFQTATAIVLLLLLCTSTTTNMTIFPPKFSPSFFVLARAVQTRGRTDELLPFKHVYALQGDEDELRLPRERERLLLREEEATGTQFGRQHAAAAGQTCRSSSS